MKLILPLYLTASLLCTTLQVSFTQNRQDSLKIPKREYTTSKIIGKPLHIDGMLDEETWNQVDWSGDFVQREPYETQTSAPHFYQRPDANHFDPDSTLISLGGYAGNLQIGRAGNSKWMYTFWITWRSPGFNTNDIGYVRRNDEIQQVAWVGFYQGEPFSIFRNFRLNINQWSALTFGKEIQYLHLPFEVALHFCMMGTIISGLL